MECRFCNSDAEVFLTHGETQVGFACFRCADHLMRDLAAENVRGGGTLASSIDGYHRWRAHVGRPCTVDEATATLKRRGS
jgi:hypothetical protein